MDEKSKGKVTHALLLLPNSAEENYDELLHLVVGSSDLYPSDSTTPYEKTKDDIGVKILSQAHHFSDKMLIVVFKHYVSRPESEELRMCCYQLSKKKFGVSQAADLVLFILHANLLEAALEGGSPISTVWNASLQMLTADGSNSFSIDKVMALVSLCAVFLNESHIPFRLHFNSEWRDSVWRALQQSLTSPELSSLVSGGEASGRLLWCVFAARAVITAGNMEKDKTTFLDAVLHRSLTGPSSKKLPNSLSIVEDVCLCYPFVAEECVKVHSTLLEDVTQTLAEHLDQQPLGAILHLCYDLENATLSCKNKFRTLTLHVLDCLEHRHHDSFFVADLGQFLKIKTQGTPTTTSSSPVLPDTLIDLYLRLLSANGGAINPVAETVLIRYMEERSTERQKLESAFRKLLVRRLGQSACFLDSVTPQPDFLVTLIRLGEPLYRRHDPTSVSILRRLFELLSFAVEKECHHMTSVNEVASLLSMPFCQEIQIKGQLSQEIIKKATQLLSNEKGRLVKPLDRAFLVAYLVRADIPIPDQLQQALAH
ncbi:hypothetical protein AGDE_17173 [Angomonas deanei]|uniref:Uncharacterized protein n=1 Tax=Angomonas deanei TaxID=59799 RepID=A0A7G2C961_9TRYP|nr:hypothetical protein AGDE_17173 [Angomonas deanei]CAD2215303.1 hypothetical protein, conserved [Angomonas deanei]|eukprot:EPY15109.1 hypothetical protein AGDE_17173 [Angomonas deanei]